MRDSKSFLNRFGLFRLNIYMSVIFSFNIVGNFPNPGQPLRWISNANPFYQHFSFHKVVDTSRLDQNEVSSDFTIVLCANKFTIYFVGHSTAFRKWRSSIIIHYLHNEEVLFCYIFQGEHFLMVVETKAPIKFRNSLFAGKFLSRTSVLFV